MIMDLKIVDRKYEELDLLKNSIEGIVDGVSTAYDVGYNPISVYFDQETICVKVKETDKVDPEESVIPTAKWDMTVE